MARTRKQCKHCSETKLLNDFVRDGRYKDGYRDICKPCFNDREAAKYNPERAKRYKQNAKERDPVAYKRANKNRNLKANFGITIEDYDRMLAAQNGVCYLCGKPCGTGNFLAVDHDHTTGAIRGLLCLRCNRYKVGNQTLATVRQILHYMENPPADAVFGGTRHVPSGKEKPKRRWKRRTIKRRDP
jgi:hypothetical protein